MTRVPSQHVPPVLRSRRNPRRTAFFAAAGLALAAAAAWALLGSRLLVVRSVEVTGTHLVSRAAVVRAAGIAPGTPLIRVNLAAVARRVEGIAQVRTATVTRNWPSTIVIAIRERTPALAVAQDGRYALIDGSGVVVRWARRRPPGMPLLRQPLPPGGIAGLRGSPAISAAVTVLGELPARVRRAVRAVSALSPMAVTLYERGVTIVWGGAGRARAKARELALLMRVNAAYYDVSDPSTAVTRS
jgi:cell division protein FtsQ